MHNKGCIQAVNVHNATSDRALHALRTPSTGFTRTHRKNSFSYVCGFTLIELLVVIAIIGILSAIVLTSLGAARQRSRVAALKAEVHEIRNQAEIFYTQHKSYIDQNGDTVCDAMTAFRDKVFDLMGNQPYPFGMCLVTLSGDSYAAEVALGDNEYWCSDGTNYTGPSQAENPAPAGPLSSYDWSSNRICDGNSACGSHVRTTCNQL